MSFAALRLAPDKFAVPTPGLRMIAHHGGRAVHFDCRCRGCMARRHAQESHSLTDHSNLMPEVG